MNAVPRVAVAVRFEVMTGGATTVTVKLPVAVFPVRELIALNPSVKVPRMLIPGERVIRPVAALIEAPKLGGFEVSAYVFAPLLLRIW